MDPDSANLAHLIFVIFLVLANGFFVAVEFALVRAHPTKLRSPELKDKFGIKSALRLIDELDVSLSATQLGITIASLFLGAIGENYFHGLIVGSFVWLSVPWATVISHAVASVIALVFLTFLHVVFGELAAKSLAIRYPEQSLLLTADTMRLFCIIFKPAIYFLTSCANLVLRLFGITRPAESERVHSLAELAMLVSHSTEQGMLDKTEEEMLKGIFGFSETVAREVMTPRTDLVAIPVDSSIDEVCEIVTRSGFSRFPVIGEKIDDVVGVLLLRDLIPVVATVSPQLNRDFSVRKIMREPYFVPGTKPIDDLLNEFKRRKLHLAVVLDEHGGVDGIVTLEDVIEEIVGDIFDESDTPEKDIVVQENGDILVDGGVLVADINGVVSENTTFPAFEIPEGDYDTIAGFIYTSLGRMPRAGDKISLQNGQSAEDSEPDESARKAELVVEKVKGRRIETVRIHRFLPPVNDETGSPTAASQHQSMESAKD